MTQVVGSDRNYVLPQASQEQLGALEFDY